MMNVTGLVQTCGACPSQWEGRTDDGREFYARYRWGHFRVDLDGSTYLQAEVGDGLDGSMSTAEMKQRVAHLFTFSATAEPQEGDE